MSKSEKRKYILIIIALCGISASSTGVTFNSAGVFYGTVSADLGIRQGTFSMYQTLSNLVTAFLTVYTSKKVNQYNFKRFIVAGTILTGIATCLMGNTSQIWIFYLLGVTAGLGKALYFGIFIYIIINNWFVSHHGFATGFVSAFAGVAGAICAPLFSMIISSAGWRIGYFTMGILVILLNLPIILLKFSLEPAYEGAKPYLAEKASQKGQGNYTGNSYQITNMTCSFRILLCFMLFSFLALGITTFPQHFPSYLTSLGYTSSVGAFAVSLCLIGNILTKISFGTLSDHFGSAKVTLLMLFVNALSMVLLIKHSSTILIMVGAFLFGSIYSISAVSVPLMIKERFGINEYQRIFPYVNLLGNVGLALFISTFGYIYDISGSYLSAFVLVFLFEIIIVGILAIIYKDAKTPVR